MIVVPTLHAIGILHTGCKNEHILSTNPVILLTTLQLFVLTPVFSAFLL